MKYILFLSTLILLWSCDKGNPNSNQAPNTKLALESINLQGQFRLNSVVRLTWFGTDVDGYVKGFEFSTDQQNWTYTTIQDSVFKFSLPAGSDTINIDFYVRSIDDKGAIDPSPAYLKIPLKNTPPVASIDKDAEPKDTVLGVATWRWFASDNDGDETITQAEIKFNNGSWFTIDPNQRLLSFVIDPNVLSGPTTAKVYYGNNAQPNNIDGLLADGENTLYVRVSDIAGSTSDLDTSKMVFFKKPKNDFLVISGQPQSVTDVYLPLLNNLNIAYDYVDFGSNGGENQPAFWNPTFRLTIRQYKTLFIYTDPSVYSNPTTGETKTMLSFMSQGIQEFTNQGKKVFITTSFNQNTDLTSIQGTYPIDGIVTSSGQARISNDSAITSIVTGNYPSLKPSNILIGVVPMVASADAELFYRAQLTKISGWTGDNLVAARRRSNNNINEVFFGVELHKFNQDLNTLQNLFDKILLDDFNW